MAFFFNKASMETIEEFCLLKAQTYIVICVYAKKKKQQKTKDRVLN